MAEKIRIIMDCDPGIDDGIALAYVAAHREEFDLLAVTTMAGNQTIDKVTAIMPQVVYSIVGVVLIFFVVVVLVPVIQVYMGGFMFESM